MLKIDLSEFEFNYINTNLLKKNKLTKQLFFCKKNHDIYSLLMSEDEADEIRDLCGEQLQIIGFNQDYELTCEGKILESLIDKLFVG